MEFEVKSTTLPAIATNFDIVKADLKAELAKYDNVVVTLDTLADDKKLAKEITAKGKAFDTLRKEKLAEISKPLVVFGDHMKELTTICSSLAETIKSQVKTFEGEKLKDIGALLKTTLEVMRTEAEISFEFRTDKASDVFIKLGAITKSGALTKGSKDGLSAIVSSEKAIMQTTALRLAQLEAESFKAGLEIPLVRLNVEYFLFGSDEEYSEKLSTAIHSEYQRQQAAVARKKELDDKAIESAANHNQAETATVKKPELRSYQKQTVESPQPDDGKVAYTATATFKLRVPCQITEQQIATKLEKMMADAGITSLHSVGVMKDA